MTDRGQSSLIGVILIILITSIGISVVLFIGVGALADAQQSAKIDRAESTMTQLDSQAALVALGSTNAQQIDFPHSNDGVVNVNGTAGSIKILVVNETGESLIVEKNLGSLQYEFDDTTLAYQGGGVWRERDGNAIMVSPPEYHYRDQTLTFPIIRVSGTSGSIAQGGAIQIRNGGSVQHFPSATQSNPLRSGHLHVEITSKYHEGWKSYFETRSEGAVTHHPMNQTVSVNLTVPVTEEFETAISATSNDGDAISHSGSQHGGFGTPQETGADQPSASPRVADKISTCVSSGCKDLVSEQSDGVLENGTYYAGSDVSLDETTYDTSSGPINIVVDGNFTFAGGGGAGTTHHEIVGDGSVTVYAKGDVDLSGNTGVNTNGQSQDLLVLIHSNGGDFTVSGTAQYTGLIYAPHSSLTINGGGSPSNDNIVGSAVVHNATSHGNGNLVFQHPVSFEMEFESMTDITYLHITENRIEVADG